MELAEFKLQLKETFSVQINKATQSLQEWWMSDDGITIQNSLISLGSIVDYGYFAGMLAPYLLSFDDEIKRDRAFKHIPELSEKLLSSNDINTEFVNSLLDHQIFEDTIKTILNEVDETKINAQKGFFINTYTHTYIGENRIAAYRELLLSLSSIELQILGMFAKPDKKIEFLKQNSGSGLMILHSKQVTALQIVSRCDYLLKIDIEMLNAALRNLENHSLLTMQFLEDDKDILPKNSKTASELISKKLHEAILKHGWEFIKFIQFSNFNSKN